MLLTRANYIAVRFQLCNYLHIQADKEEEKMQDRISDFENIKIFTELAWNVQHAGQNYPDEFILYDISNCNYMVEGVIGSYLTKPSKILRNIKPMRKEKIWFLTPKTMSQIS